jgi:IMP dehydrogenase
VITGTSVSAQYVSETQDALDMKELIHSLDVPVIVGGSVDYYTALNLMRAGAVGILVGFGGGARQATRDVLGIEVPMASAISGAAEARSDYLDESGGRYVAVIADGGITGSGDIAKALACGADAAMVGVPLARASQAPGKGYHWGREAWHPTLVRGLRQQVTTCASLEEILLGPSVVADGSMNLVGALRRTLASTGYTTIKSFQKAKLILV